MSDEKKCRTCISFDEIYCAGGGAGDGGPTGLGKCQRGVTDGEWRRGEAEVALDFSCLKWEEEK